MKQAFGHSDFCSTNQGKAVSPVSPATAPTPLPGGTSLVSCVRCAANQGKAESPVSRPPPPHRGRLAPHSYLKDPGKS